MYRKLLSFLLLSFLGLVSATAGTISKVSYYMTVHFTDGSFQNILLDDRPSLQFDKNSLTVSTTDDSFIFSDIAKFTFSEKTITVPTNINETTASQRPTLRITDSNVTFLNIGSDATVNVYSVSGQKVLSTGSSSSSEVSVDWSSFPRGIFIFRVNNYTFKLLKK